MLPKFLNGLVYSHLMATSIVFEPSVARCVACTARTRGYFSYPETLYLLYLLPYPVSEVADVAVDSWFVPLCASDSPACVPRQPPHVIFFDHQGASAIALQARTRTTNHSRAHRDGECVRAWVWQTWHESTPPTSLPAQNMVSVTVPSNTSGLLHLSRL